MGNKKLNVKTSVLYIYTHKYIYKPKQRWLKYSKAKVTCMQYILIIHKGTGDFVDFLTSIILLTQLLVDSSLSLSLSVGGKVLKWFHNDHPSNKNYSSSHMTKTKLMFCWHLSNGQNKMMHRIKGMQEHSLLHTHAHTHTPVGCKITRVVLYCIMYACVFMIFNCVFLLHLCLQ